MQTQRFGDDVNDYVQMSPNPVNAFSLREPINRNRTMSEHEKRKQRELAERVKKDQKNQEDLKRDAQDLVEVLKVFFSIFYFNFFYPW